MTCLRCLWGAVRKVAEAPDGSGAWEVCYCGDCGYSWRTSEGEDILNPEKRDPRFQLDKTDLSKLQIFCKIPPLKE